MKNIIKCFAIILSLILLLAVSACDKPSNNVPSENPNDVLKIGEIAIGMWVTPPKAKRSADTYKQMRESGINFVNGFPGAGWEGMPADITHSLTLAAENDLKFLVADTRVSLALQNYQKELDPKYINSAMEFISEYSSYPAYAGQLFKDEPSRAEFGVLSDFIKEYSRLHPDNIAHVNMFPDYASMMGTSYNQYVSDWFDMANPVHYSYDSYPLLDYDENSSFIKYEIDGYLKNLDILREVTASKDVPLWSFIQTLGISQTSGIPDKRTPSREDIRWQVYVNLAFGVKGIQYFCYWTPHGGSEKFTPAMVDVNGETTERYDYVKELNADFNEMGKLLLKAKSEGIMLNKPAAGRSQYYELEHDALTSFGNVTGMEGADLIAGCFSDRDSGKKSMLLTPATPRASVNATLNVNKSVKSVTVYQNGETNTIQAKDGKLSFNIAAGDAIYIVF